MRGGLLSLLLDDFGFGGQGERRSMIFFCLDAAVELILMMVNIEWNFTVLAFSLQSGIPGVASTWLREPRRGAFS